MKIKEQEREDSVFIGVLGPRHTGNYALVLGGIIRTIDLAKASNPDKKTFIFIHDGVTSGSTGEVIEVINKIQASVAGYGYRVTVRKMPLDIEMYGKKSHHNWVDRLVDIKPDRMLVFDDRVTGYLKYASQQANKNNIDITTIGVKKSES